MSSSGSPPFRTVLTSSSSTAAFDAVTTLTPQQRDHDDDGNNSRRGGQQHGVGRRGILTQQQTDNNIDASSSPLHVDEAGGEPVPSDATTNDYDYPLPARPSTGATRPTLLMDLSSDFEDSSQAVGGGRTSTAMAVDRFAASGRGRGAAPSPAFTLPQQVDPSSPLLRSGSSATARGVLRGPAIAGGDGSPYGSSGGGETSYHTQSGRVVPPTTAPLSSSPAPYPTAEEEEDDWLAGTVQERGREQVPSLPPPRMAMLDGGGGHGGNPNPSSASRVAAPPPQQSLAALAALAAAASNSGHQTNSGDDHALLPTTTPTVSASLPPKPRQPRERGDDGSGTFVATASVRDDSNSRDPSTNSSSANGGGGGAGSRTDTVVAAVPTTSRTSASAVPHLPHLMGVLNSLANTTAEFGSDGGGGGGEGSKILDSTATVGGADDSTTMGTYSTASRNRAPSGVSDLTMTPSEAVAVHLPPPPHHHTHTYAASSAKTNATSMGDAAGRVRDNDNAKKGSDAPTKVPPPPLVGIGRAAAGRGGAGMRTAAAMAAVLSSVANSEDASSATTAGSQVPLKTRTNSRGNGKGSGGSTEEGGRGVYSSTATGGSSGNNKNSATATTRSGSSSRSGSRTRSTSGGGGGSTAPGSAAAMAAVVSGTHNNTTTGGPTVRRTPATATAAAAAVAAIAASRGAGGGPAIPSSSEPSSPYQKVVRSRASNNSGTRSGGGGGGGGGGGSSSKTSAATSPSAGPSPSAPVHRGTTMFSIDRSILNSMSGRRSDGSSGGGGGRNGRGLLADQMFARNQTQRQKRGVGAAAAKGNNTVVESDDDNGGDGGGVPDDDDEPDRDERGIIARLFSGLGFGGGGDQKRSSPSAAAASGDNDDDNGSSSSTGGGSMTMLSPNSRRTPKASAASAAAIAPNARQIDYAPQQRRTDSAVVSLVSPPLAGSARGGGGGGGIVVAVGGSDADEEMIPIAVAEGGGGGGAVVVLSGSQANLAAPPNTANANADGFVADAATVGDNAGDNGGDANNNNNNNNNSDNGSAHSHSHHSDNGLVTHEELKQFFLELTERELSARRRLHNILYGSSIVEIDAAIGRWYNHIHVLIVLFAITQSILMTMPLWYTNTVEISSVSFILESITTAFFTVDFLLRIVSMPTCRKLLSLSLLIDFLSFIGFYIEVTFYFATADDVTSPDGIIVLRVLRILRIFRVFKIMRQHKGVQLLTEVMMVSSKSIALLGILIMMSIMIFASVLFSLELIQSTYSDVDDVWYAPDGTVSCFQSIPETFLFICTTMCTVGYGDCVPKTWQGRAWTSVVMFSGVLVLSFPNILIGANFSMVHRQISERNAKARLGKYFRKVRMVVRFIRMWREFRVKGYIAMLHNGNLPPHIQQQQEQLMAQRSGTYVNDFDGHSDGVIVVGGGGADGLTSPRHPGGVSNATAIIPPRSTRMQHFMFRLADFPDRYLGDTNERAMTGAIDTMHLDGLSLLSVMQRLLECFSGCATVDELTTCYHYLPLSLDRRHPRLGNGAVGGGVKTMGGRRASSIPTTLIDTIAVTNQAVLAARRQQEQFQQQRRVSTSSQAPPQQHISVVGGSGGGGGANTPQFLTSPTGSNPPPTTGGLFGLGSDTTNAPAHSSTSNNHTHQDHSNGNGNSNGATRRVTHETMFEVILRGAAAQLLSLYIIDRRTEQGLVCLTKRGIDVLANFQENATVPCLRCFEEARDFWHATTKHSTVDIPMVLEGYPCWKTVQNRTRRRDGVDFVYDLRAISYDKALIRNEAAVFSTLAALKRRRAGRSPSTMGGVGGAVGSHSDNKQCSSSAPSLHCQCRYCNAKWGLSAPMRPTADYCFAPDEELLLMEVTYAQQSVEIMRLEKELAKLQTQIVTTPAASSSGRR